jgi:4-amino-4-deoxy-L-arabinose transferase-like glycosyltransferase
MSRRKLVSFMPLIALLFFGVGIIFYQFPAVPKKLSFDEVEFAKLALSLNKLPYVPYSNLATGHSTLYFYILNLSMKVFGVNAFGLRFPSALFGVVNILFFYFLMKRVFKNKGFSPFLFSLIFISLRWYFNFARFSFEATFLLFLELASIDNFLIYLENNQKKYLIASGVFAGLAFNSYTPGRIFFLLPLLFFALTKLRTAGFHSFKNLLYFLLPFIIIALPLTTHLYFHEDVRFKQQSYMQNQSLTPVEKADFLWQNIKSTALMFNLEGDVNGRHNYPLKPALNPALGVFFVVGFLIAVLKRKEFFNQFFLAYFIISVIPTLLTYPWENPNMLRTFTVIPAVVYFIGIGASWIINKNLWLKKKYVFISILLVFVLSSIYEVRTYYLYQKKVFKDAFEFDSIR